MTKALEHMRSSGAENKALQYWARSPRGAAAATRAEAQQRSLQEEADIVANVEATAVRSLAEFDTQARRQRVLVRTRLKTYRIWPT